MIENSIQQFRAQRNAKSRVNTVSASKERAGLGQRQIAKSQNELNRNLAKMEESAEPKYDPSEKVNAWAQEIADLRAERAAASERADQEQSTTSAMDVNPMSRPRPERRYENTFTGEVTPPEEIKADGEFTSAVSNLAGKYNISVNEIYSVIQGESAFNHTAQNPSGATGLFQFMPVVAEELGTSVDQIRSMSPTEQVALYDKYLERWSYTGDNRLGIMQAAPAFASRGPDEVVYAKGTAAWEQNPGWRTLGDGPITVQSINSYYSKG